MPYLWYPPTLLALPLEIRHLIYSFLLIYRGSGPLHLIEIDIFKPRDSRRTVENVFLVNRQIHHEAFEYYYSNNTFSLSLISPYLSLKELAPKSGLLLRCLNLVRSLRLVINTSNRQHNAALYDANPQYDFRNDTAYPKQQQQWTAFLDLISRSREGSGGRKIKSLVIEDWWLPPSMVDVESDPRYPLYASLVAPLKASIDQVRVCGGPCKKKALR